MHLKIEILVERELWRSPSPASLSKEDCCHLCHCPSRQPLSILRAGERRKGCFLLNHLKFIVRCPGLRRSHSSMAN